MKKKDENMEWEMEAPHLASLPRTTPYSAPDNYFSDLTTRINQSVFVDGLMQKENQGFTIPQNYFEDLGIQIENRIAVDQLMALAKTDGFKTPVNYFDKLNADILSKTSGTVQKTKVVRLWQTDFMKYASAACFILLTASGLYINQQNTLKETRTAELANEQMLYDIDESVIIDHIQESQAPTTASASDTEMENYILNHFSSSDLSNNL
jgi:hypothetical protein